MKRQIEDGKFGKLVNAEANISRDRLGKIDLSSWRYQAAGMPGGVVQVSPLILMATRCIPGVIGSVASHWSTSPGRSVIGFQPVKSPLSSTERASGTRTRRVRLPLTASSI